MNSARSVGVKEPTTLEELKRLSLPYTLAGMPGAFASTDGVRIRIWSCSYSLQNANIGKEGFPVKTFRVTVSFEGRILSCTRCHNGNQPDISITRDDKFLLKVASHPLCKNFEYKFLDSDGQEVTAKGAWILLDNGYPNWPTLQCPSKRSATTEEARWSRYERMSKEFSAF